MMLTGTRIWYFPIILHGSGPGKGPRIAPVITWPHLENIGNLNLAVEGTRETKLYFIGNRYGGGPSSAHTITLVVLGRYTLLGTESGQSWQPSGVLSSDQIWHLFVVSRNVNIA